MKVQESLYVSRLPEYLVNGKKDQFPEKELIDNLKPTTINLAAALSDKLIEELSAGFNNWNDKDRNYQEFKLQELFEGLGKYFALEQVELLKGFFRFKGTSTDVTYILNTGGLFFNIYEADYFFETDIKVLAERYNSNGSMDQFISNILTSEEMNTILLSMVNYLPSGEVDPRSVIEVYEFLSRINMTEDQLDLGNLYLMINDWFLAKITPYSDYDGSISAIIPETDELTFSFDKDKGVNLIVNLVKSIVETRLSVCVSLKGITILIGFEDKYDLDDRVKDYLSTLEDMSLETDEVSVTDMVSDEGTGGGGDPGNPGGGDGGFHFDLKYDFLDDYRVVKYYVDNVNPWMVGGTAPFNVPGIELGISDIFKVEVLQNGQYVEI